MTKEVLDNGVAIAMKLRDKKDDKSQYERLKDSCEDLCRWIIGDTTNDVIIEKIERVLKKQTIEIIHQHLIDALYLCDAIILADFDKDIEELEKEFEAL